MIDVEWQNGLVGNAFEHEIGPDAGNAGNTRKLVDDEVLKIFDVGYHDAEHVVAVARH